MKNLIPTLQNPYLNLYYARGSDCTQDIHNIPAVHLNIEKVKRKVTVTGRDDSRNYLFFE